ncbi:isochorismatase family protein [Haloactinopolyspora sp.]|uniref:isochorismatase family protein n=1 Tax=Haloactinopolyspora sp. TaxID=1966353 RepID=UPI0026322294|nr:isochorismatase family protein [Haloactinopolyspora sp.]
MTADDRPIADALVVVDVQHAFVYGARAVPAAQQLLTVVDDLLVRARSAGVTVVLVQNDGPPGAPEEPETPGWALAVERGDGDLLVRKEADDAFEGTSLQADLRERGVTSIAVAGLHSEMCVAATVRGALAGGFGVVLPHDAHATQPAPAWAGVADEVPAAVVSRVAEWSVGDQAVLVPHAADVRFERSGAS